MRDSKIESFQHWNIGRFKEWLAITFQKGHELTSNVHYLFDKTSLSFCVLIRTLFVVCRKVFEISSGEEDPTLRGSKFNVFFGQILSILRITIESIKDGTRSACLTHVLSEAETISIGRIILQV